MKNYINYIKTAGILVVLLTGLVSCKKSYLEIVPKGLLVTQTTADYDLSLNDVNLMTINGVNAQMPMGDEAAGIESYLNATLLRTQRLFRWDKDIYQPDENASEMQVLLQNLYAYNKIINEVGASTEGTDQQKKSIKAEALAGRAWTNFLLINYYGKPYNASTSATDPGFPITTVADVTVSKFSRATVQEVYDFIVKDLTDAMPDLPVKVTYRVRMSRAAAEATLGKVYLFMGKFSTALPLFDAAFTDLQNSAIPVQLYDYKETFGAGGLFLPIGLLGPAVPNTADNEENFYSKQTTDNWSLTNNELVINSETVQLFSANDLRRNFYKNTPFPAGAVYPNGMLRRSGPNLVQMGCVLPDLYLMRAECKARLDDLEGAKTDVEALRMKRISNAAEAGVPAEIASQKLPLIKFILEERTREFAMTGFRWFDMRRLSADPLFPDLSFLHQVYSAAGDVVATYPLTPERLTLRLPLKLINENPGMENNP